MPVTDGRISVCPLGSGSKGNSYWVETSKTAILVDAGFSCKQLLGRIRDIGRDIHDVEHIFITHEHRDHTQSLAVLLKKYKPTLWATGGTLRKLRTSLPEGTSVRRVNGAMENAGDLVVQPIPVSHDAADPVAYRFDAPGGSAAIMTDLGHWNDTVAKTLGSPDLFICEANHDPVMLEHGPYPWYLKQRISSPRGHLDNFDGAELARRMVDAGTSQVMLAHLSEINNEPNLAEAVFREKLLDSVNDVHLHVAEQALPGPWMKAQPLTERVAHNPEPSIAESLRRPR